MNKQIYLILSGEGEIGAWTITKPTTAMVLQRKLTKERHDGDRWAHAWTIDDSDDDMYIAESIDSSSQRTVPRNIVKE